MSGGDPGTAPGPDRPLVRSALAGEPADAARALLGRLLIHQHPDGDRSVVRLVEVEAYGPDDPASHSHRGRTDRNASMFGPPGTAYVYRAYGVHWCLNVSVGPSGVGAAVLLRAAVVLSGEPGIRRRRPRTGAGDDLLRGPGNLARGMGVEAAAHDGIDLLGADVPLRLARDEHGPGTVSIVSGPRVGVTAAPEVPWRFWIDGCGAVSRYRRSPRAAPSGTRATPS